MKILVRALMTHTNPAGSGLAMKGNEYLAHPYHAQEMVDAGVVEFVDKRGAVEVEAFRSQDAVEETKSGSVTLAAVNAPWFTFSDGSKVMGVKKAAEHLGVDEGDVQPLVDALQDEGSDA